MSLPRPSSVPPPFPARGGHALPRRGSRLSLREALDRLPKVELHCHIEGTMRPETVVDLARRNGIALPTSDVTDLYRYGSLTEFLSVFWLVQSVLVTRDDWARLAFESVVDAAAHGRVYAELFFTPARHLAAGQRLADIVAGLADGLRAAETETGSRAALIADIDRAFGPAAGEQMVRELIGLRRTRAAGVERVIGIGMDSTELGVNPAAFAPAYRLAASAGLRRTAHQGENSPAAAIATVIDVLGAERLDHGLSLLDDPELTRRVAAERIPLTVCPNSNILIANAYRTLAEHPFPAMRTAGVLATLNTDDPAMSDLDLGYEYSSAAEAFGYGFDDMVRVALDGVEASWLDPGGQANIRAHILDAAAGLRLSMGPAAR
jgi:adenosine deaminase